MTLFLYIFFALLGGLVLGGFFVWFMKRNQKDSGGESFIMVQNQLNDLSRMFRDEIGKSQNLIHESVKDQFNRSERQSVESQKLIQEITRELTHVKETGRQVAGVTEQLQSLQNVLQNPKQRGVLGEYFLETVLQNVLPPESFQMQYGFSSGEVVDAVVFVKDKVIPIDSKFSLENYNRYIDAKDANEKAQLEKIFVNDLKLRIQETEKYIRPSEKTTDFAFMFIPSEGIYYELLSNSIGAGEESLIQRAAGKYKVIIVSPTSFLAYLQTVLQGLKALEIEEKALDIIKNVEKLKGHMNRYEEYYKKLGNVLGTTVSHYNAGYKELQKIDKDVVRIADGEASIEPLVLDKPLRDEE